MYTSKQYIINAVGQSTTSEGYIVGDRYKMGLQVLATTGTPTENEACVFTVEVSNNGGTTWTPYNRLITNSTLGSPVASVTVSITPSVGNSLSTGSMMFFPQGDTFESMRVIATISSTTTSTNIKWSAILHEVV